MSRAKLSAPNLDCLLHIRDRRLTGSSSYSSVRCSNGSVLKLSSFGRTPATTRSGNPYPPIGDDHVATRAFSIR